ncbi:MAG: hypothetical protein ACXWNK_16710 [Vulcanimicrobiaceae bacterium]
MRLVIQDLKAGVVYDGKLPEGFSLLPNKGDTVEVAGKTYKVEGRRFAYAAHGGDAVFLMVSEACEPFEFAY